MDKVSADIRLESLKSFQSTIRKTEKAVDQMKVKGAQTVFVEKRLHALHIGLAVLETVWNGKPNSFGIEELVQARTVLAGLLPTIENQYNKSKAGSSQRTLLERRIQSLELAIMAIDDLSN
ncbi:hypothetical protein [Planococcus beijingensis]|uniref:hypothetical protein n=1 Tax=Planococcus beijingensis TaxID=2782551 RepID=UPI00193B9A3D|nr:hypothetical protein [Planococcus beijingensis]